MPRLPWFCGFEGPKPLEGFKRVSQGIRTLVFNLKWPLMFSFGTEFMSFSRLFLLQKICVSLLDHEIMSVHD